MGAEGSQVQRPPLNDNSTLLPVLSPHENHGENCEHPVCEGGGVGGEGGAERDNSAASAVQRVSLHLVWGLHVLCSNSK